jgi:hypothetical protein
MVTTTVVLASQNTRLPLEHKAKSKAVRAYADVESGDIFPCVLNVGTRVRWLVSFTSQPLYPWGSQR